MYVLAHFEETRFDKLHRIIGRHPLAALAIKEPRAADAYVAPNRYPRCNDYVERSAT